MFVEGAASGVFPAKGAGVADLAEQGRLQGLAQTYLCHVAIAERREGTGLGSAVGSDVEETTSCRHTAVKGLLVARETEENHFLETLATCFHYLFHLCHMLVEEGQM